MKSALILEGGAMRGLYTAGVLDILMENNIYTDMAIGVSAGAMFGINYKSRQIGRVLRYNLKYAGDKNYMGWHSFLTTGNLMNEKFCFYDLPFKLDRMDTVEYRSNNTIFKAVVTNLNNGKAEYISLDDLENPECMEYLRASGSLPFLSKPVIVRDVPYLDGGIADSVPVQHCIDEGYDRIIVVLTRPKGYRKSGDIKGTTLFYKKYPDFAHALKNRNKTYNEQYDLIDKLEQEGKILVIRPSKTIKCSRTEKDKTVINEMHQLGMQDCLYKLEEITEYLK